MAKAAAGYVVQGAADRFLSRSKRFVRHQDRSGTKGAERAWVHGEEDLMKGGWWTWDVVSVIPARYDPDLDQTVITGDPMPYDVFVELHAVPPS